MLLDDFLIEYWIREESLEGLWNWIESKDRGHLHLQGEGGVGKSWLLRGLAVSGQEKGFVPILADRLPGENPATLLHKLIDHTEFLLDMDVEHMRMLVNHALFRHGPSEAWHTYIRWLGSEVQGRYLLLLDGFPSPLDVGVLPPAEDLPEGFFVISSGEHPLEVENLILNSDIRASQRELRGYLRHRMADVPVGLLEEVVRLSRGNWRQAYQYTQWLNLVSKEEKGSPPLPTPDKLLDAILDTIADKVGREQFRSVHLDILVLLAIAQVPVNSDLLVSWGVPKEPLAFALFDLRGLIAADGESSQLEALFSGEHYSIGSTSLAQHIVRRKDWLDRVSQAHRRVIAPALDLGDNRWTRSGGTELEFYSLCFIEHHLRESGRTADLVRLSQDGLYAERCWAFARLAREQGFEEIALTLMGIAAQILSQRPNPSPRDLLQSVEVQAEFCGLLTQLGRYADGARWGDIALRNGKALSSGKDKAPQLQNLWIHCLLSVADPYLFMGLVEPAQEYFSEALQLSQAEASKDRSNTVHALRGLARVKRMTGEFRESLKQGAEAMELARKLILDEGEEWANYLFDLLMEQADCLRNLAEESQVKPNSLELMAWRWEALRFLREAADLYDKFAWPNDMELAAAYLEESMLLFELERWSEAEMRLSKALDIYRDLPDVHPGEFASLEYLRSQALALMNRIGEASGSLTQLVTPEMLNSLEISERALVLFFQAKVLTHQGYLREATHALSQSIQYYQEAIEEGNDELLLELVSSRAYLARILTRRGRFELVRRVLHTGYDDLEAAEAGEPGQGMLERADLLDVEALVHYYKGELPWALERCNESLDMLDQVERLETEPDLESERSGILVTRALIQGGLGDFSAGLADCDRAVEIESRRAEEGYDTSSMWCALHMSVKAGLQRQYGQLEQALASIREAIRRLQALPSNQQAHLGPSLGKMHFELGQIQAALGNDEEGLKSLTDAAGLLETEMLLGKGHLIAVLLEVYTVWLDVQKNLSNGMQPDLVLRWTRFFESWPAWESFLEQESRSDFLKKAIEQLRVWARQLKGPEHELWRARAPLSLRSGRKRKEG